MQLSIMQQQEQQRQMMHMHLQQQFQQQQQPAPPPKISPPEPQVGTPWPQPLRTKPSQCCLPCCHQEHSNRPDAHHQHRCHFHEVPPVCFSYLKDGLEGMLVCRLHTAHSPHRRLRGMLPEMSWTWAPRTLLPTCKMAALTRCPQWMRSAPRSCPQSIQRTTRSKKVTKDQEPASELMECLPCHST